MADESPTDVALRYVAQQVETMRVSMHDELAAMRNDLGTLAAELRMHVPQIAVIAHRVSEVEKDVAVIQTDRTNEKVERERERAADRRLRLQLIFGVVVCVLGAVLAWVNQLIGG